jgi:hypothetical protein
MIRAAVISPAHNAIGFHTFAPAPMKIALMKAKIAPAAISQVPAR